MGRGGKKIQLTYGNSVIHYQCMKEGEKPSLRKGGIVQGGEKGMRGIASLQLSVWGSRGRNSGVLEKGRATITGNREKR